MKGRINPSNFYRTTLTGSSVNNSSETGTFEVTDKTVNGYTLEDGSYIFWLIFAIDDMTKYEIFRCTNVSSTTITYDLRISPNSKQTHASGTLVSMNDFAEVIRYLGAQVDDFGYVEAVPGTTFSVKAYGGRIYQSLTTDVVCSNSTVVCASSTSNFIYYDDAANAFGITTVEPASYYVCAKVTTSATYISDIEDYRPNIVSGGSGGGSGGGHTIKVTNQDSSTATLTQRNTLRFKKVTVTDDSTNLETIVSGKRLATPDYIPASTTEYISTSEQMIVFGGITIDGTLDNQGSLVLI